MSGMPAKVNGHAVIEPPNTRAPDTRLTVELRRNLELSAEDTAALNAMIETAGLRTRHVRRRRLFRPLRRAARTRGAVDPRCCCRNRKIRS